jgi:glycosyltransferase involved in cell wall biosynthesis
MKPERFCFLTTFYPPFNFGGDGIGVQRLARGLAKRGHDVTVIHDADAYAVLHKGPLPAASAPDPSGIRVVTLRSRVPLLSTLLTQQTGRPIVNSRRLTQLLADGHFDVVNFNNISLVGGPDLLAYGGDAIKLYLAHEHWLVCPTHVLWRHNREPCDARECLRCQLQYRRPPQLWRYTGLLDRRLSCIDRFIAMSEFSRQKHREFGFPYEMTVLPYFLPDPEDAPAPADGFETFGITLLEAFSPRTPVIARRLGPFPEIIRDSGAGDLFETPDELRAAMRRMQAAPESRAAMARAGFDAYCARWSERVVVPRYLEIVAAARERRRTA